MATSTATTPLLRIDGTPQDDVLTGTAADEDIDGGAGDDILTGGGGNDRLSGGTGDDFLQGDAGNDTLLGGDGDDDLLGGDGDDNLDGGAGVNLMLGGTGDDHYKVRSRSDLVYDSAGHDSGTIYVDWYKTDASVEDWTWAPGVQKLPYWIDALVYPRMATVAASLETARTIYYSFAQTPPTFFTADDRNGFKPFNGAQIDYTRQVLGYIETQLNVHFVETADATGLDTVVFANNTQKGSAGYGAPLDLLQAGARVMIASTTLAMNPARDNGAEFLRVVTHEIGHALGLKHPFADPDSLHGSGTGPFLPASDDSLLYTEMSYTGHENHPGTYSPLDIAALQYIYGPAPGLYNGDTRWVLTDEFQMISDGGGHDILDGMGQTQDLTLFLDDGYWSHIGGKADSIVARGQFTINIGTIIEDAIGGSGNDHITGNEADNALAGGAGNDVLQGRAGNDLLDGGAGRDTAVFAGAHDAYLLTRTATGITVIDKSGAEGVDTLTSIERLAFGDGTLAFDLDGVAGQAYRLYAAAFDRKPDLDGLTFWIGAMDAGQPLYDVGVEFTKSDEFVKMYGATHSSEDFLTKVYQHILHRAPDASGYAFWLDALHHGLSEGRLLAEFGESPENVAQVVGQIQDGIWFLAGAV